MVLRQESVSLLLCLGYYLVTTGFKRHGFGTEGKVPSGDMAYTMTNKLVHAPSMREAQPRQSPKERKRG